MAKRLIDLNPQFVDLGARPGHRGYGVELDCPCGSGACARLNVPFKVALDGHATPYGDNGWDRKGDTFDALSLGPSIQRVAKPPTDEWLGNCAWHGFIENGLVRDA